MPSPTTKDCTHTTQSCGFDKGISCEFCSIHEKLEGKYHHGPSFIVHTGKSRNLQTFTDSTTCSLIPNSEHSTPLVRIYHPASRTSRLSEGCILHMGHKLEITRILPYEQYRTTVVTDRSCQVCSRKLQVKPKLCLT